jgi:hypothetical protein
MTVVALRRLDPLSNKARQTDPRFPRRLGSRVQGPGCPGRLVHDLPRTLPYWRANMLLQARDGDARNLEAE